MTTREQKLRELERKWRDESRSCGMGGFAELSAFYEIAADELAAILDEEVGVSDGQVSAAVIAYVEVDGVCEGDRPMDHEAMRAAILAALKEPGQ